jgi:predicted Zn-dependent protease
MKASYSREDEQEADALAAVVAKRAGFDPLRGIQFFNRAQRDEAGAYAKVEQQLANERANAERAIHNCNQLQATWNSSPAYRTQRNANIVNAACQDAQARADRYNDFSRKYFYQVRRASLLRTHPPDRSRIAALAATVDYLNGRRPLSSLANIGQGYRVLVALESLRASAGPTSR